MGGREKQRQLGQMERIPLRKLRVDLADIENDQIHLKETRRLKKDWHDNLDDH